MTLPLFLAEAPTGKKFVLGLLLCRGKRAFQIHKAHRTKINQRRLDGESL